MSDVLKGRHLPCSVQRAFIDPSQPRCEIVKHLPREQHSAPFRCVHVRISLGVAARRCSAGLS